MVTFTACDCACDCQILHLASQEPYFTLKDEICYNSYVKCLIQVQNDIQLICLIIKITRQEVSKDVTPHVLCHTFSITAIQKEISLLSLQLILGHDYITTTEIYLNLIPEDVVREFNEKW